MGDVRAWLDSPGGHVYVAQCGGYQQALAALVSEHTAMQRDSYELNAERQRQGLRPLAADEAQNAVRPRGGPVVSGDADGIRRQFRDPSWRVGIATDDSKSLPVRWDPQAQRLISFVAASRR